MTAVGINDHLKHNASSYPITAKSHSSSCCEGPAAHLSRAAAEAPCLMLDGVFSFYVHSYDHYLVGVNKATRAVIPVTFIGHFNPNQTASVMHPCPAPARRRGMNNALVCWLPFPRLTSTSELSGSWSRLVCPCIDLTSAGTCLKTPSLH